ncbi:hypothetical protein RUM43_000180 [Polyplax serrata]|uniref:Uncharacterized protein n=1 Tax=Polyplax serrata TaxID=468196 RepID=A0AAN8XNL6_POLSC
MELYNKMPHNKGGTGVRNEFLTSTAWNALIHHPVEDSDTEELPSTVDMDAIKGAPGTPITGQVVHWNSLGDSSSKNKIEESDDSSSDDEEKDSDSNSRSSSDSESDESDSGSCSWSSSSESSSCSSPSPIQSKNSSPSRQSFSIRETNFDQGGLKLKLSALKSSKKNKSSNKSQASTESDSCSSQSQEVSKFSKHYLEEKDRMKRSANKVTFCNDSNELARDLKIRKLGGDVSLKSSGKSDSKTVASVCKTVRCLERRCNKGENVKSGAIVKPKGDTTTKIVSSNDAAMKSYYKSTDAKSRPVISGVGKSSGSKKVETALPKRDGDILKVCPVIAQQCTMKVSEVSKLRSVRRKPGHLQQAANQGNSKTVS